ncbi:MAG: CRISPR-associated endonuclease Cas2 [Planctomycetaceae bacterium]|nr:CRISPR-associated endonuclease Cas2 [Planctomycetaceae bacterium]
MSPQSQHTVVLYDVPHDRTRTKVSDACLNFGLARFQYSAFEGSLSRNRREELALLLAGLIAERGGRIRLMPVCAEDVAAAINFDIEPSNAAKVADDPAGPQPRLAIFTGDEAT